MTTGHKEKRFLDALEALFTGAYVEGDSGFVNLMRIKRQYFESIQPMLMAAIDRQAKPETSFREELFDKLWTFFRRYFSESGSIYFRHLPAFAKTYERVYADDRDVALAWKTHMLYYVKSDVLVRSMPVKLPDRGHPDGGGRFYFDASEIEHKRNNEKREFVFAFDKVDNTDGWPALHLKVAYSERGKKTKTDDIIKQARKNRLRLGEDELEKACRVFRGQTEVDFFINKDARGFLREQFDLWLYQFMFKEESIFEAERVKQLQAIQKTAYDIIDFIAQFEDELRRVWEKPKFVRGVHYVVTLDKLPARLLKKISRHKGFKAQTKEWRQLGMIEKELPSLPSPSGKEAHLPLDTKHFKDLELEILDALGNLDEALDGELVHSENWQALNTLSKRYQEKVKCIYIDPPFNLDGSDQFDYRTNYKDSCWATLLENRLTLAKTLLSKTGSIFVRCDYNGNWIVRSLMDNCFGEENFTNEIQINRSKIAREGISLARLATACDTLFYYRMKIGSVFNIVWRKRSRESKWVKMHSPSEYKSKIERVIGENVFWPPQGRHWSFTQEKLDNLIKLKRIRLIDQSYIDVNGIEQNKMIEYLENTKQPVDSNWTDIPGYTSTTGFQTENSERLLDRVIRTASNKADIVMDFFLGSGTTTAVAQKIGGGGGYARKWLGVEMGEHFYTVILPRMKKVLTGHQSGVSKQTDYCGGGVFKYYTLEQYEETLKNSYYKDGEQIEIDSQKSPFEQYVFFNDDKLAHAVKPLKNKKLKINLRNLYPDVDIAESLSNALGKPIRRLGADQVTFADGTTEKTNPAKMTEEEKQHFIALIKPYLWWGE